MSITLIIVIFTAIVSIIAFTNHDFFLKLKHFPVAEARNKEYYRMLTSGFLHGDYIHLFMNMFVLYEFGRYVENHFTDLFGLATGNFLFLFFYLIMIVIADYPTFLKHKGNPYFSSVGASGAVSGILFMYIILNPWAMLGLFAIIPIPAIVFGALYLWYSSWASKHGHDLVDHDAHFYGAIAGVLILIAIQPGILPLFLKKLIEGFPS